MHRQGQPTALPALKRRSSPQAATSRADAPLHSSREASRPAGADAAAFGHPWAQPTTLNALSASLAHQQRSGDHDKDAVTRSTSPPPALSGQKQRPQQKSAEEPRGRMPARVDAAHSDGGDGAHASTMSGTDPNPLAYATTTASNTAVRAERLRELEEYVLQRAGRHVAVADRQRAVQKSLSLLPTLYPALSGIVESLQRYTDDVALLVRRASEDKAEALRQLEGKLYKDFETFFEGKIRELVLAKQEAEARAEAEHAAAYALRKDRDSELMKAKEELLLRLNEREHTEDQFRDFRHLIASVFQTNQQLTLRIEQLEGVLKRHRIDIPAPSAELAAYHTSSEAKAGAGGDGGSGSGAGGGGGEVRSLSSQVPVAFMAAANKELVRSRLTLQQELLHSAFDDHSAYRLRIEGLTRENQDLSFHISELEEKVKELYAYIHQKRFITRVDEHGDETTPLTPRPREVPLTLQTELGIELRHSTANILTELSTVAINMKHQLNSALLRARQLQALSTWLHDGDNARDTLTGAGVVASMLQDVTEVSVIPVFPVASWPSLPHFLRTNISPEVRNFFWTEAQIACILYNFFATYKAVRGRAQFVRDSKMLAPRVYQLFEHRRVLLTRLDASKEDAAKSDENIPFGYVVSQFAREVLSQLSPQNTQDALPLVLPGTIATRYPLNPPARGLVAEGQRRRPSSRGSGRSSTPPSVAPTPAVEDCAWVEAAPVVELDLARFTYNMWYAAMRYQETQPLCQLFMDLVDGRLPLETFDVMEAVLARAQRLVDQLDSERSHQFTYPKLVNGVVRWVSDAGAQSVRRGVQAVVRAFETYHSPMHGGTLSPLALFADETYCDRDGAAAIEAATRERRNSFVPANGTAVAAVARAAAAAKEKPRTPLPGSLVVRQLRMPSVVATASSSSLALPPLGATAFVRFWRSFVRDCLEDLYSRVETVLGPLVEESEAVVGLYLVSVPRAAAVLAELDDVKRQEARRSAAHDSSGSGGGPAFGVVEKNPVDTLTGAKLVAEAADLLGVRGVARSFLTLLEARQGSRQGKRVADHHLTTETVLRAVSRLPRFKSSTHFPQRWASERAASAARRNAETDAAVTEPSTAAAALGLSPTSRGKGDDAAGLADAPKGTKANGKGKAAGGKKKNGGNNKKQLTSPTDAKGDPIPSPVDNNTSRLFSSGRKVLEPQKSYKTFNTLKARSGKAGDDEMLAALHSTSAELGGGDLVEWYSLRHTIRQIMPDFPYLLFQPDDVERAEEAASQLKSPPTKTSHPISPVSSNKGD